MKRFVMLALLPVGIVACGGSSDSGPSGPQGEGEVTYRLTFTSTWNAADFPTNFPGDPHFSPVIGATHNDTDFMWRPNEISSPGIESVAETGSTTQYSNELAEKRTNGSVENLFRGGRIESPDAGALLFKVTSDYPLVSAISMLAPSPDWFVGIRDVNLRVDDEWLDRLEFDLRLYDSGTDEGVTFSSGNSDGGSGVISLLTSAPEDTDFSEGVHRTTGAFVGQFVLELVENGAETN